MQKEKKNAALFFTAALISCSMSAQQPDTTKVPEVVISATRSEQDPMKVGRSVSVISAEDIKKSGFHTLSELLSQQEGLYIVGNGQTPGSNQSLFTRGAASNQTLVMVDGVRLSDPSTVNNTADLSELSLADVDRIEIVRGSHSTMYGSAGVGGVVNIITRREQDPGFHVNFFGSAGTFGTSTIAAAENLALNYTDSSGFYVNAGIFNANISGLDATVDTVTDPNAFKNRDRDGFDKMDITGRLGYKKNKLDIYGGIKITQQIADIDKRAYADDENYTLDFHRNLFTYGATFRPNDKMDIRFYGGYSMMERFAKDDSSKVDANGTTDHTYFDGLYNGTQLTNELQYNYHRNGIDLVAGGGMYGETMNNVTHTIITSWMYNDTTDLDSLDLNVSTYNGFLRAGLNGALFNDKWEGVSLSLGARFNSHSVFGTATTFDINPGVQVGEGGLLYGVYSTGFNAPSLYQMYAPEKDFTSGLTRGNDKLDPETSVSWELGFKQQVNDRTKVWASIFHTEVKNLIEYVYLWEKNTSLDSLSFLDYRGDRYLNIGTMITRGAEGGISTQVSEKFLFGANLCIVGGKLTYASEGIDTAQTHGHHVQLYSNGAFAGKEQETIGLSRRPSSASLNLSYMPCKPLTLRADLRYVAARGDIYYEPLLGPFGALGTTAVEDYSLIDLSLRYKFKKFATAMLRVENLLDKEYSEINGFTTRGRGFYVGLRFEM
ncbi:MAG: iron complex outermembrane recepter protein [Bacteroidetes bacterium]|nr:MAG: iron complex outermembrane recepter protein [Bacteroidota bacterium]